MHKHSRTLLCKKNTNWILAGGWANSFMTSRRQSKKTHVASAWVNTSRVIRLCHSRVMKWKDASKIPASFLNLPPPSVFLHQRSFSQPQRWNYANHVAINFSRRFSLLMTPFAQIAILTSKIRGKRTSFALKRPATSLKKLVLDSKQLRAIYWGKSCKIIWATKRYWRVESVNHLSNIFKPYLVLPNYTFSIATMSVFDPSNAPGHCHARTWGSDVTLRPNWLRGTSRRADVCWRPNWITPTQQLPVTSETNAMR